MNLAAFLSRDRNFLAAVIMASRGWIWIAAICANHYFAIGRPTVDLLRSWDVNWYLTIVDHGYDAAPGGKTTESQANWAFFPLFPLAARGLAAMTGLPPITAATFVAHAAFAAAIFVLFRYCRDCLRLTPATTRFVAAAMCFTPYSLYFSVPYTEACYFLLMISTVYLFQTDRRLLAGCCGALLSATRNLGVFLVVPLAAWAVREFGLRALCRLQPRCNRTLVGLAMMPLGLALYMLHLYRLTGDALAFVHVQVAWGSGIGDPLRVLLYGFGSLDPSQILASLTGITGLVAAGILWRRFPIESAILFIGSFIPLCVKLMSLPRFVFTLYPIYVCLGLLTENLPRTRRLTLVVYVVLLALFALLWICQDYGMI